MKMIGTKHQFHPKSKASIHFKYGRISQFVLNEEMPRIVIEKKKIGHNSILQRYGVRLPN